MPRESFQAQLQSLKQATLELGNEAVNTIGTGVEALKTRDRVVAQAMIDHDQEINRRRYSIEDRCYALMATQQPLAGDLREIVTILLVSIELERIADHAKNLGEIVIRMGDAPLLKPLVDIPRMAELCQKRLLKALEAFAKNDADLGLEVCRADGEIDDLYAQVFRELMTYVIDDPRTVQRAMNLLFAAHNLERIGDRITNIGERVIYMVTGKLEEWNVSKMEEWTNP